MRRWAVDEMGKSVGKDRALAYGIVGGVAAAAIAVGPIIGGLITTALTSSSNRRAWKRSARVR